MEKLLHEISKCQVCVDFLPLPPKPILRVSKEAKILIIGQAPGIKAHNSGKDFDDASGKKLRSWMGISEEDFYNTKKVAVMPMGFCYPGKGKTGDLPPRPECKPQWHDKVLSEMQNVSLTILIGQYAQKNYLGDRFHKNLTETVRNYNDFLPEIFPIPHPSPTNRFWMAKNKWFEATVLPVFQQKIKAIL